MQQNSDIVYDSILNSDTDQIRRKFYVACDKFVNTVLEKSYLFQQKEAKIGEWAECQALLTELRAGVNSLYVEACKKANANPNDSQAKDLLMNIISD